MIILRDVTVRRHGSCGARWWPVSDVGLLLARIALALACILAPAEVFAKADDLLVIPASIASADPDIAAELVDDVSALLVGRGITAVPATRLREVIEAETGERPADLARMAEIEKLALEVIALRRQNDRAALTMRMAQLQEIVGQGTGIAMQHGAQEALLGACIEAVRSKLERREKAAARSLASWCLRSLAMPLEEDSVPPSVRDVFREAEQALPDDERSLVQLEVRCMPAGCRVVHNGQLHAAVPFRTGVVPGRLHRISVECDGSRSRDHWVKAADQAVSLTIEPEFDRSLRTVRSGVGLHYEARSDDQMRRHGASLVGMVDGREAIILALGEGRLTLHRIGAGSGDRSVAISPPYGKESLRAVLGSLYGDAPVAPSDSLNIGGPNRLDMSRARRRWPKYLGATALLLGAGAITAAGILEANHVDDGEKLRALPVRETPRYSDLENQWEGSRWAPIAVGASGAALLSAGSVGLQLTSKASRAPWWATTLSGAAGIVLAGWGISDVTRGDSCRESDADRSECSRGQEQRDRGALMLLSSSPLLSLSIAQLLRDTRFRDSKLTVQSRIDPARSSWGMSLRMTSF